MKNTEYRKGNLVFASTYFDTEEAQADLGIDFGFSKEWHIATIESIEHDNADGAFCLETYEWGDVDIEFFERTQDIPITEEWLERFAKNGLVADGLVAEYWYRKLQIKYSKKTKKCIAGIVFENHPVFLRTLEYVHELQNLFFALTGEELELKKEVAQ
jgi:hypothetical protein